MTKKILLGLGSIATIVGLGTAVISCSSNDTNGTQSVSLATKSYNSLTKTKASYYRAGETTTQTVEENILSPGLLPEDKPTDTTNTIANQKDLLSEKFGNFDKETLQFDFDNALTDFYESYEIENETANQEIEIEIEDEKNQRAITVTEAKYNKETKEVTAKLEVRYKVKTETEKKTRDDNESEEIKKATIDWKAKVDFIDHGEMFAIKDYITTLSNKDVETGSTSLDVEDLKEVFLGEKEDDDKDDKGVFDKIQELNGGKGWDQNKNSGSMVGYTISPNTIIDELIKQVKPAPKVAPTITAKDKFKVPSIKLNTYFKPNTNGIIKYSVPTATKADKDAIINAAAAITDSAEAAKLLGVNKEDLVANKFSKLEIKDVTNKNIKAAISSYEFKVTYTVSAAGDASTIRIDKFLVSFANNKASQTSAKSIANAINALATTNNSIALLDSAASVSSSTITNYAGLETHLKPEFKKLITNDYLVTFNGSPDTTTKAGELSVILTITNSSVPADTANTNKIAFTGFKIEEAPAPAKKA